jgi:sulfur carrier protein
MAAESGGFPPTIGADPRDNMFSASISRRIRHSSLQFHPVRMLDLVINGQSRRFEEAANVAHLLDSLALSGKRVAVERNGEIVPRSRYGETALASGDRLEIVVAVGGG